MHELQYVQALYSRLVVYTKAHNFKQIVSVRISTTRLSGIEKESFQFYWKQLIQGTDFINTKLYIRSIPSHIQCITCQKNFRTAATYELPRCKYCGSIKTVISEENVVKIQRIEIET